MRYFEPGPSGAGVYLPSEFSLVHTVFLEIAQQSWFSRSPEAQLEFAKFVIRSYRQGLITSEKLRQHCLAAAKERFAETDMEIMCDEQSKRAVAVDQAWSLI